MFTEKEKGIIEQLPQIPYILDQVGEAMKWNREVRGDGAYGDTLDYVNEVVSYAKKVSLDNFFKTHLVLSAFLIDIPKATEDERFITFKSASNSVENTLNKISVPEELSSERGCFKALSMTLVPLASSDEDCFSLAMLSVLSDLKVICRGMKEANVKTPITAEDYIEVLGYSLLMSNIRMSSLHLLETTTNILNQIDIILNNDFNY